MADHHRTSCILIRAWSLCTACLFTVVLTIAMVAGSSHASAQRLTAQAAGQRVAETYGVEVLRVREIRIEDGVRAYAVTVMAPGGDINGAFQVTTLLVDPQTGDLVSQYRQTPTGHAISGAPSNIPPTEVDGPALRRRSTRP